MQLANLPSFEDVYKAYLKELENERKKEPNHDRKSKHNLQGR